MRRFLTFLALICLSPISAWAGGAHQTTIQGIPYRWEKTLVYNLDRGDLKPGVSAYSHDAVAAVVSQSFTTWRNALTSGDLPISEGASLPLSSDSTANDVNENNASLYLNSPKPVNPILLDADGEIIDSIYGDCAKYSLLAFAGFETLNSDTASVVKGRAVFSGACIPDGSGKTVSKSGCGPCVMTLDESQVKAMILHELGHLLGMDHSQVNPNSYLECSRQGVCPISMEDDLPTMFPLIVPGATMQSLHRDDIAYFNRLYGNPQADTCSVAGRVLAGDGQTELRGVEVVARNLDSRFAETDAVSFVSGAEAPRLSASSKARENCAGNCGDYLITGLQEGESYQLCVQNILSQFSGGSGIEPVDPPAALITPDCPKELTVTCECGAGGCQAFTGLDIVTQGFDPSADAQGNLSQDSGAGAGGCSLMPERPTGAWARLKKPLVFALRFQ